MKLHSKMYRNFKIPAVFLLASIFVLLACRLSPAPSSFAAAPPELQSAISQKSKELLEVASKIAETQKNLETTQGQRRGLQQEVSRLDGSIKTLTLGIKSSEILIAKLGLEVDSLQYDIADTEATVQKRQAAILLTLEQLREKDYDTPLTVLLRNQTLASGVSEMQNLVDLNSSLETEIGALKQARDDLAGKLQEASSKKNGALTEHQNLQSKKVILADTKHDKQILLTQTKNQEQLYQQSLSALEKQQEEIANQIEALDSQLRQQINPAALPAKRSGVLGLPIIGANITQWYGATEFAKNGYRGRWHNGLDFGAPLGTPVLAAESGRVIAVGNQDKFCYRGAYGKFIVIAHDNNLTTLYGHLSLQIVAEGDKVERGQVMGYVGRTGYATGPHLHFTVYASPTVRIAPSKSCGPKMPYGGDLNPSDYL